MMFPSIRAAVGPRVRRLGARRGAAVGRALSVRASDVFLTSYPRSGNTWLRFLLANLLSPGANIDFSTIEDHVPDIYQNSGARIERLASPRLLKSHEYLDPRYRKIIYVVRDPRDVAVSYYYYEMKHRRVFESHGISQFIDSFLEGEIDSFGSWGDHVGGWLGSREDDSQFLMVYYEMLRKDPVTQLANICRFLEIDADEHALGKAVDASNIDRMRELEGSTGKYWVPLRGSRGDIPFIRRGMADAGVGSLREEDRDRIGRRWPTLFQRLGYL